MAIIGAGAVGVAIATRLAGRVGRIALVEAGGDRFERRLQAQFFREDHLADARHLSTELGRRRMLGGTTSVWGGRCIPLDSEDFEGSVTGTRWPISRADVAPWTASALQFLQAGNDDFSTAALPPSTKSTEVDGIEDPDLKLDRIERFSEPTNVWSKWGQPLVKSKDVVVLQGASCTNIRTTSDARQVSGIDLRTQSGRRLQLNASTVVLACGGLETPRLLLASRDHRSCGLGNEHDLVGRYYMTHFAGSAGTLKLRVPGSDRCFDYARTEDGVYARRLILLSAEARRLHKLGNIVFRPSIHPIADPSHGDSILSAMVLAKRFVSPEYAYRLMAGAAKRGSPSAVFLRHGVNIAKGIPQLAGFGFDWLRRRTFASRKLPSVFLRRPDATYPLAFDAEQSPEFASRVSLGATADPFGMPRLSVSWKVNETDLGSIARALHVLREAVARTGLGQLELKADLVDQLRNGIAPIGGHQIGTARMGSDPRTGVVDKHGELWNTKGLFVSGNALFPTCGCAGPTLTSVALAFRLAEHLGKELTRQVVIKAKC